MVWGNSGSNEGEFKTPEGITVDKDGKVFVVDRDNSRVQVFGLPEDKTTMLATTKNSGISAMGMVPQGGGTITTTDGVEVKISSGAIEGGLTIAIKPEDKEKDKDKKDRNIQEQGLVLAGAGYEFNPEKISFDKPVEITIPYEETREILDMGENNLKIFYWNEETSEWEQINNSRVNAAQNKVSADINHFSTYRVMGVITEELKMERVVNYPNPFSDETKFIFTLWFVPNEVEVRIYTLSGRLIKKIMKYDVVWGYNEIHWNGADDNNNKIANGTYIYKLIATKDADKIEKINKLVIIK
jgi:hypothetical protein